MLDFKIRNVIEEDFIKISQVAEYCNPMTNERKSIYHLFTKFFKKTSLVVKVMEKLMGFYWDSFHKKIQKTHIFIFYV